MIEHIFNPGGEQYWMTRVFAVVFCVMLINFVAKRVLARLHRKLEGTSNPWDDALVDATAKPFCWLIWLLGLTFAADMVGEQTGSPIFSIIEPVRRIGFIVIVAWFAVRVFKRVETNVVEKWEAQGRAVDKTTVHAIGNLGRVSVVITAFLIAMQAMGYSVSGILAFGGIGGIAVGFASKDFLANLLGALMIYLDRPFSVGDWIRSDDKEIEGTVERIGWRMTIIRTFDQRPLYIPNSVFSTIGIENPSRMTNRRIRETIGVRYADVRRMKMITDEIRAYLLDHPEIDTSKTLMVNFNSFGPSSLDFFIYTFTRTTVWTEFHTIKQAILLDIAEIIERNGAEIAFPTNTVHVPDGISLQAGAKPEVLAGN